MALLCFIGRGSELGLNFTLDLVEPINYSIQMSTNFFLSFPVLMRLSALILGIGWLILVPGPGFASASDLPSVEQKKIEALIFEVERMTDAVFIRNEKQYSAELAAEFLRRKWKSRRSEIHSAVDFIDKVASFSSTTGKPYRIRWSDGKERSSAEFFRAKLSLLESRAIKPSG